MKEVLWPEMESPVSGCGDGQQPCECSLMSVVLNCYTAHALNGGWGLLDGGTGRGTYPSSLIWQTKLRGGTEGKDSSQNQDVAHESTAFDWTQLSTEGVTGLSVINSEQGAAYLQSFRIMRLR